MPATPLYHIYVLATRLLLPVAARIESKKLEQAGISPRRRREKTGYASLPRPPGKLIWFHAASVGESLSILSLIESMKAKLPDIRFLITSGTATSASLLAKRAPAGVIHQFAPLDAPGPLRRFLSHWNPDAVIFVESELWPQMLMRSHDKGIPMALVNARLSERSLKGWKKRPKTAQWLLSVFRLILTQNPKMARSMQEIGAPSDRIETGVNLKSLSAPLPVSPALLDAARTALAGRVVWTASSTHTGEEETVLDAHQALLSQHPELCLILAPRHPERGDDLADMIAARGFTVTRRSKGEEPSGQVFLADSLGELGIWYALSPFVFLGGSLLPIGGHNPFEVAQAGCAVLSGVHVANFAETFAALEAAGAARHVSDAADLAHIAHIWLSDANACGQARENATQFMSEQSGKLDEIAGKLISSLGLHDG